MVHLSFYCQVLPHIRVFGTVHPTQHQRYLLTRVARHICSCHPHDAIPSTCLFGAYSPPGDMALRQAVNRCCFYPSHHQRQQSHSRRCRKAVAHGPRSINLFLGLYRRSGRTVEAVSDHSVYCPCDLHCHRSVHCRRRTARSAYCPHIFASLQSGTGNHLLHPDCSSFLCAYENGKEI